MSFNGRYVRNIILFASQQGANAQELIDLSGHDLETLSAENTKVETKAYNAILERAVEVNGDPCLGLHAGEYLNLSAAGIVLQIMQTSRTAREAMQYACDFNNLACSKLPLGIEDKGDLVYLTLRPDPLWLEQSFLAVQQTMDGILAFTLREFRTMTMKKHPVTRILYEFAKPPEAAEYARVLETKIDWNQDQTALVFKKEDMDMPVLTSDFALLQVLVQHANEKIAALEEKQGFASIVKRAVLNLVKPEFPGIEQVACNLNLSVRSLQRKLRSEGLSFRDMMEDLKYQFALSHLKKRELSISEIAYLLNYSDPSGFVRSFKRWTGQTPQSFRDV